MKKRFVATVLMIALLVSMTGASAKSWSCESGICVETNKPCGQLVDCIDGSCGQDDCVDCGTDSWVTKAIAILAALGITSLIVNEMASSK